MNNGNHTSVTLIVSKPLAMQMKDQAANSPEWEICGLLFGMKSNRSEKVKQWYGQYYVPIPNLESSHRQFRMDPVQFTQTFFSMKNNYPECQLIAIVHSHPSIGASSFPSLADLKGHWSNDTLMIILSCPDQSVSDKDYLNIWDISAFCITSQMTFQQINVFIKD